DGRKARGRSEGAVSGLFLPTRAGASLFVCCPALAFWHHVAEWAVVVGDMRGGDIVAPARRHRAKGRRRAGQVAWRVLVRDDGARLCVVAHCKDLCADSPFLDGVLRRDAAGCWREKGHMARHWTRCERGLGGGREIVCPRARAAPVLLVLVLEELAAEPRAGARRGRRRVHRGMRALALGLRAGPGQCDARPHRLSPATERD